MVESLMADLLFRLFLPVVLAPLASGLAVVLAELPLPVAVPPAAGCSPPAAVSDFFLWLFFAEVPVSELALEPELAG